MMHVTGQNPPTSGRPNSFEPRRIRVLLSAVLLVVAIGAAGVSPTPAQAAVPEAQRADLWQHACVDVAQGTVSDQDALVCVHSGLPQWVDHVLTVVQRICERPMGGTFEYRSGFPIELAACFFE